MRFIFLLAGCLASVGLFGQTSNDVTQRGITESLVVESYTISNGVSAFQKSKTNPVQSIQINLKGQPGEDGSKVTSARINFFYENDPRRNQKPVYNEEGKYIVAHFPIEAFSNILDLLKLKQKKKTQLTFKFVSLPSKNLVKAYFELEGEL